MATLRNPVGSVGTVGEYIRDQRRAAQYSLRQLAEVAGVSNPYLSQIERGLRKPSAEILNQIAKGLRISAETLYVRAGFLDERDERPEDRTAEHPDDDQDDHHPGVRPGARTDDTDVVAAITADPALTERQKHVLLDVYASFRSASAAAPVPRPPAAEPQE